jgi:hypothetical protein
LAVQSGTARLYVRRPDLPDQTVELSAYVANLYPGDYRVRGPQLVLDVLLPRPKFIGAERASEADTAKAYARLIQDLPRQHCVLRITGETPRVVRVGDVDVHGRASDEYIQAFYTYLEERGSCKKPGQPLSATTVFNCHRVLKGALRRAGEWDFLVRNPVQSVKPLQPVEREHRILSVEELAMVLTAATGTQLHLPVP